MLFCYFLLYICLVLLILFTFVTPSSLPDQLADGVDSDFSLKWVFWHRSPLIWFQLEAITHFGMISPANVSTWYVSLLLSTIQNGPVHQNRSLPSIKPILVWKTSTGLPIANIFSFCCRCRSTNALVCLHFFSSAHIACSRFSCKRRNCFELISIILHPIFR